MKLELQQQEIPLLYVKRVTGNMNFTGTTPTNQEVTEEIAKNLGSKAELVKVKHIYTDYRKQSAKVIANVYNDEKVFAKFLTKKEKAAIIKAKEEAAKKAAEAKTQEQSAGTETQGQSPVHGIKDSCGSARSPSDQRSGHKSEASREAEEEKKVAKEAQKAETPAKQEQPVAEQTTETTASEE